MSAFTLSLAIGLAATSPAGEPTSVAGSVEQVAPAPAATESTPTQPAETATTEPQVPAQQPSDRPGDIVVTARQEVPGDPLANLNAQSYEVIQGVDKAIVAPISLTYEKGLPKPMRDGLRNFLRNLEEPIIALNYMLQLKPGRAVKSVARFTVNTAMGMGGLFDIAKRDYIGLPYTPNTFGNTFACWGIGSGPYFFLPLIGPTTLRDVIGVGLDRAALPAIVGKPLTEPYYAIPANVIDSINDRIEIDDQLNRIRDEEADPYAATRDLYLKQRKSEIAAICPKKGEVVDPTLPPRPGKGRD